MSGAATLPLARPEAAASDRTLLLIGALERSGRGAPADRFGAVLRRWAQEGRPYRGQVFSLAEVEAAIAAVAAKGNGPAPAKASSSSRAGPEGRPRRRATSDWGDILGKAADRGAISLVEVRTKDWPPPQVLAAAAEAASSLGPVPSTAVQGTAGLALLKGLFGLASKSREGHDQPGFDVEIATLDGVAIPAHKAVLGAVSDMLACRFGGQFGDAKSNCVDASDFSAIVVYAAVKFAYLGKCRVQGACLGALFRLADLWQFSALTEAVGRCWDEVPAACCLQILAQIDADTPVPAAMLGSVIHVIVDTFKRAAEVLESAAGAAQGASSSATPGSLSAAEPTIASPAKIALSWRYVRELHDVVSEMPLGSAAQLAQWVSRDDALSDAATFFFVSALRAIGTAGPEESKHLCSKHLKAWLPPEVIHRVVELACLAAGLTDECGNERPWLRWAYAGCPSFGVLWRHYEILHEHHRRQAALGEPMVNADPAQPAQPAQPQEFPRTLDLGFAAAIVEELHRDAAAVRQWEDLVLGPMAPEHAAAEESLKLLARLLGYRRCLPMGLSPQGARCVLSAVVAGAPPAALRVVGPERMAGLYERRGGSRTVFLRSGAAAPKEALVLQRVVRARDRSICVFWKGIPLDVLQSARAEWKIQAVADDAEVDTPLALALDEAEDPSKVSGPWWIRGTDNVFRQLVAGVTVFPAAVSPTVLAPCVDSVLDWAGKGGSLEELEATATASVGNKQDPLVLQICRSAQSALATSKAAASDQKQNSDASLKRRSPSGDRESSRQASKQIRTATGPQRGGDLPGETAADQPSQPSQAAPMLPTLDEQAGLERVGEAPAAPTPQATACGAPPGSSQPALDAGPQAKEPAEHPWPHTPPPRSPRWRTAPSPPCWPRSLGDPHGAPATCAPTAPPASAASPAAAVACADAAAAALAVGVQPVTTEAPCGDGAKAASVEGKTAEEKEEEKEEEEEEDPRWVEASRIVDATSAKVNALMEQARGAAKREKQALLAQKRLLENNPEYLDALQYLEDPAVGEDEQYPNLLSKAGGDVSASACASAIA